jgi:hypothetical protein
VNNDGNALTDGTDPDGNGIINAPDAAEAVRWEVLTDQQESLSISDIAFSPLDANVIYAGLGRFSSFNSIGGTASGLLKSTTGGGPNSWVHIASNQWAGTQVATVLPTSHMAAGDGQVVLVATRMSNGANAGANLGLWISTNGGEQFTQVSGVEAGLPAGAISDLIVDPNDNRNFYVAVRQQGVFRGRLSDPASPTFGLLAYFDSWTAVNGAGGTALPAAANIGNTRLAAHDAGASTVLYAGIADQVTRQLINVFRSADNGGTWNPLDPAGPPQTTEGGAAQGVIPNGQGETHFSLAAHPTDPDVVFVGGDTHNTIIGQGGSQIVANSWSARIFRGDRTPPAGVPIWEAVVAGFANGTAPHADSRNMVFDSDGSLIETDDGGINRLRFPDTRSAVAAVPGVPTLVGAAFNRHWISLNGNLSINEFVEIAWDSV